VSGGEEREENVLNQDDDEITFNSPKKENSLVAGRIYNSVITWKTILPTSRNVHANSCKSSNFPFKPVSLGIRA